MRATTSCAWPCCSCTSAAWRRSTAGTMRQGASDYLQKPFDPDDASLVVARALERRRLAGQAATQRREAEGVCSFHALVGKSPRMRQLSALLQQAAGLDITVLLGGETGTGKELAGMARESLHRLLKRHGVRSDDDKAREAGPRPWRRCLPGRRPARLPRSGSDAVLRAHHPAVVVLHALGVGAHGGLHPQEVGLVGGRHLEAGAVVEVEDRDAGEGRAQVVHAVLHGQAAPIAVAAVHGLPLGVHGGHGVDPALQLEHLGAGGEGHGGAVHLVDRRHLGVGHAHGAHGHHALGPGGGGGAGGEQGERGGGGEQDLGHVGLRWREEAPRDRGPAGEVRRGTGLHGTYRAPRRATCRDCPRRTPRGGGAGPTANVPWCSGTASVTPRRAPSAWPAPGRAPAAPAASARWRSPGRP
ncbi:MAG: sigma 54-interacting transcriptional regulator [Anaeromyxobacter sp.]|nr:sigma 54-interacting transcriptional regulator [Anaeromyxobacter sp.]